MMPGIVVFFGTLAAGIPLLLIDALKNNYSYNSHVLYQHANINLHKHPFLSAICVLWVSVMLRKVVLVNIGCEDRYEVTSCIVSVLACVVIVQKPAPSSCKQWESPVNHQYVRNK